MTVNVSIPTSDPPVNSDQLRKPLIRIGIPPAPRATEGVIFLHLAGRHKKALRERGWRFFILHTESVTVDEYGEKAVRE